MFTYLRDSISACKHLYMTSVHTSTDPMKSNTSKVQLHQPQLNFNWG